MIIIGITNTLISSRALYSCCSSAFRSNFFGHYSFALQAYTCLNKLLRSFIGMPDNIDDLDSIYAEFHRLLEILEKIGNKLSFVVEHSCNVYMI